MMEIGSNYEFVIDECYSPPDVSISIYITSQLNIAQEEEIKQLILSWYWVGYWGGYNESENLKGFHCLRDVIFDDEQCIYVSADLGHSPDIKSIKVLLNIIQGYLSSVGVVVTKVEIE